MFDLMFDMAFDLEGRLLGAIFESDDLIEEAWINVYTPCGGDPMYGQPWKTRWRAIRQDGHRMAAYRVHVILKRREL
jgi:hypothetical protein